MEKTDEQLAKTLSKGLELAEKSGNFILDQAPDLIQQLLIYKTIDYSITILISSLVLYFLGKAIYRDYKKGEDFEDRDLILQIFGGFVFIFLAIGVYFSLSQLIQIIFAPKIYLIEYISHLIK